MPDTWGLGIEIQNCSIHISRFPKLVTQVDTQKFMVFSTILHLHCKSKYIYNASIKNVCCNVEVSGLHMIFFSQFVISFETSKLNSLGTMMSLEVFVVILLGAVIITNLMVKANNWMNFWRVLTEHFKTVSVY